MKTDRENMWECPTEFEEIDPMDEKYSVWYVEGSGGRKEEEERELKGEKDDEKGEVN